MHFILCFLLNLFVFLISFFSWKFLRNAKNKYSIFFDIFYLVFIYNVLSRGILVDILRFLSNGKSSSEFGITSTEILEITLYEFISNILYLLIFFFISLHFKEKKNYQLRLDKFQFSILVFFTVGSILSNIFPSLFDSTFWFFKGSFQIFGAICTVVLLVLSVDRNDKKLLFLSVSGIVLIFIINILAGLRGSLIGVSLIIIIYSYVLLPRIKFKKLIVLSFIPISLVIFVGNYLGDLKYKFAVNSANKEIQLNTILDYYDLASEFITIDLLSTEKKNSFTRNIFDEIEFRYGAPSLFAVGFVRMYDKGIAATFNTEKNSLYSFLPRQIVGEDKPVSGSFNGKNEGMGMFASYNEITGVDNVMSDFYVSGHYYWQFGLIGVIILSIVSALYSGLMLLYVSRFNYLGHVLWITSFKPFWLLPKLWLSENIILVSTVLLPSLFLIYILNFLFRVKIINRSENINTPNL